jgi:putative oxidoreductase
MATLTATSHTHFPSADEHDRMVSHRITRYLVPIGRLLFAAIFLKSFPMHMTSQAVAYAQSQGVPAANLLVPASGVLALLGGLSVALGFRARVGAFLLVLFLVPVTFMMHRYWTIDDPQQHMIQQVMFMKNLAMLGGALFMTHIGAGPLSIDATIFKARNEELRETL